MEKQYIIITDNSSGGVYITTYDKIAYEYIEDLYDELNRTYDLHLKESQCNYMIVTGELNIKILP